MHLLVTRAARPTVEVVRHIRVEQLGLPTPCQEYDVRALVNHLLFWAPSLAGAARKESVAPPAADEHAADLTGGDWAGDLCTGIGEVVDAWSHAEAWRGTTRLGGPTDLPAPMIGGMVLGELVVHGWDLARATGQEPRWDDDVLAAVYREVAATAEQGREMGVYGPAVPVPDTAPFIDRILGLAGRDPRWRQVASSISPASDDSSSSAVSTSAMTRVDRSTSGRSPR